MVLLLPIAILLASHHVAAKHIHTHAASGYSFQVTRIHQSLPAIDSQIGRSVFDYNYNAAWLPLFNSSQSDALLVRCQYNTSSSVQPPNPYAVGPSQLAIAYEYRDHSQSGSLSITIDLTHTRGTTVRSRCHRWCSTRS